MSPPVVPAIEPTDPRLLGEPIDYLEAEHYRQRVAFAHLERVAAESSAERRAALARLVMEFLSADLVRHFDDEDAIFFPLLLKRCPQADGLEKVLSLISGERAHAKDLVRRISGDLARLANLEPAEIGFAAAAMALVESQRRCLAWENAMVLPLARKRFSPDDRVAVGKEMAARRGLRRAPPPARAGYFGA